MIILRINFFCPLQFGPPPSPDLHQVLPCRPISQNVVGSNTKFSPPLTTTTSFTTLRFEPRVDFAVCNEGCMPLNKLSISE
jgi:hypothetical protein